MRETVGTDGSGAPKDPELVAAAVEAYPAQIVLLALQVQWCFRVNAQLAEKGSSLQEVVDYIVRFLEILAQSVV